MRVCKVGGVIGSRGPTRGRGGGVRASGAALGAVGEGDHGVVASQTWTMQGLCPLIQ